MHHAQLNQCSIRSSTRLHMMSARSLYGIVMWFSHRERMRDALAMRASLSSRSSRSILNGFSAADGTSEKASVTTSKGMHEMMSMTNQERK